MVDSRIEGRVEDGGGRLACYSPAVPVRCYRAAPSPPNPRTVTSRPVRPKGRRRISDIASFSCVACGTGRSASAPGTLGQLDA